MASSSNNDNRERYSPFVSSLINSFVPDHIRDNYPNLVEFISAYLDFLETTHESGYYQNAIPQQRDIDTQEEQFLRRIEKEIGLFVPREYEATPRLFYKKISELWRSKGSTEAVETFFRLFLNDTVQVRFPWDFVLKPSDGRWEAPQKIRVSLISGDPDDLASQRIRQIEEYGLATVTKVERKVYADQTIYELTILQSDTVGDFKVGNRITTEDRSVEAEIYNSVSNIVIESAGTGYEVGDRIRLDGRSRISFEARVTNVDSSGSITEISILDFGSGTTPNHILEVQGSGRFFLDNFKIFEYDSSTSSPAEDLVFQVDTVDGVGAVFSLEFSSIVGAAGYYEGVRGQLSESIVLQDSEFYQKFSYEVVTSYTYDQWIEPLKTHVHPAGTKPFGLINSIEKIDTRSSIFSNDVLVLTPKNAARTLEDVDKSFTKILGDCASCTDDTVLLSQEDISFTKRLSDSGTAADSGVASIQDYTSEFYFSGDYAASVASSF